MRPRSSRKQGFEAVRPSDAQERLNHLASPSVFSAPQLGPRYLPSMVTPICGIMPFGGGLKVIFNCARKRVLKSPVNAPLIDDDRVLAAPFDLGRAATLGGQDLVVLADAGFRFLGAAAGPDGRELRKSSLPPRNVLGVGRKQ